MSSRTLLRQGDCKRKLAVTVTNLNPLTSIHRVLTNKVYKFGNVAEVMKINYI